MYCGKISLHFRQKIFDGQDPTNFSGFYVNGKSYYKLTGIAIQYKDVSLRWKNKKKLSTNLPHLLPVWFLTKLN